MSNKDLFGFDTERRVLTLVVTVQDAEKAKWIWENHLNGAGSVQENGVHVTAIANGDRLDKLDTLEQWADSEIAEMDCRGDEDCNHCLGLQILEERP